MDRRTQLAVVLIAVILGVNIAITARYQKKRMAAAAGARPPVTARPDAGATRDAPERTPAAEPATGPVGTRPADAAQPPGGVHPFQAASADAGDLVVETPLYRLRLSRAGALVREFTLHRFEAASGGAVNLIAEGHASEPGRRALAVVLRGEGGTWDMAGARFDPGPGDFGSGGELRLDAGTGPRTVVLRSEAAGGGALVERLTFDPDRYDFQVDLALERGPGLPRIGSYTLEWTTGLPVTETNASEDEARFRIKAALDERLVSKRPGDFRKPEALTMAGGIRWACVQSKYFMVGLVPGTAQNGTLEFLGEARTHWMGMRILQPTPWRAGADGYRVYAGPIAYEAVKDLGVGLEATVELGWRWIRPISSLLLRFMELLNRAIPNYGVVIVIVSVLSRLLFWPLTEKSVRSMRRLQELQPRMEEIRRRYKGDPKAMNEQLMLMYREQKVNPMGGCMPLVVQTPMFFALYSVLQSHIVMRNAPFVGWIDNLSGPDILARLPVSLPFLGSYVSLLPLVMGATMIWQSKLSTPPPAAAGAQASMMAQQQFMMKWLMPIMMTVFLYKMPSGLVLYWIVSTLVSIVQQLRINRKYGLAPARAAALPQPEGRGTLARSDRGDGAERRGGPAERPGRVGGKTG